MSGVWPPSCTITPSGFSRSQHRHHVLQGERLEVEAVGGVVVGRDGLRVAVDHHRLVAQLAQGEGGVHAAVVELDPLADAVGAGAEDHHLGPVVRLALVLLAEGRVEVGGGRRELGGAGVDPLVDAPHARLLRRGRASELRLRAVEEARRCARR